MEGKEWAWAGIQAPHPPSWFPFLLDAMEHEGQAQKPEKLNTPLCQRSGIHSLKSEQVFWVFLWGRLPEGDICRTEDAIRLETFLSFLLLPSTSLLHSISLILRLKCNYAKAFTSFQIPLINSNSQTFFSFSREPSIKFKYLKLPSDPVLKELSLKKKLEIRKLTTQK